MADYLLDTMILDYWYDTSCIEHANVLRHVTNVRQRDAQTGYPSRLFVSVVTLAEIEYGHRVVPNPDPDVQATYLRFVNDQLPQTLDIGKHTAEPYGQLKAWLFEHYSPKAKRSRTKRPEELVHPTTSKELGIQENDLWIAAQAVTHNLVLVTHDGLARIRQALAKVTPQLRVEDWAG